MEINIKKYIDGDLSEVEFELISERLITEKLDRDKRKEWEEKLKSEYAVEKAPTRKFPFGRRSGFFLLSIAASLLILLTVFVLIPTNPLPQYLQTVNQQIEQLAIMSDQSVLRKGPQEVQALRMEATLAYADKKYEKSISHWELVLASDSATGMDHFYLGLCYLQKTSPAPSKTVESLLASRAMNGPEEEIKWVLSLAYVKAGELEKAAQELAIIVQGQSYKAVEAANLLELLSSEGN